MSSSGDLQGCGWYLWQGQSSDSLCLPYEVWHHSTFACSLLKLVLLECCPLITNEEVHFLAPPHLSHQNYRNLTTVPSDSDAVIHYLVIGLFALGICRSILTSTCQDFTACLEPGFIIWHYTFSCLGFSFIKNFLARICQEKKRPVHPMMQGVQKNHLAKILTLFYSQVQPRKLTKTQAVGYHSAG